MIGGGRIATRSLHMSVARHVSQGCSPQVSSRRIPDTGSSSGHGLSDGEVVVRAWAPSAQMACPAGLVRGIWRMLQVPGLRHSREAVAPPNTDSVGGCPPSVRLLTLARRVEGLPAHRMSRVGGLGCSCFRPQACARRGPEARTKASITEKGPGRVQIVEVRSGVGSKRVGPAAATGETPCTAIGWVSSPPGAPRRREAEARSVHFLAAFRP